MGILSLGENYQRAVLLALNANRQEGHFCDVQITIDGDEVYAHKAILAECSPFFKTMFHSDFREGNQIMTVADLSTALPDSDAVERVIGSFYTGKISTHSTNMCQIYCVCSFLLCDPTRKMIMEYMQSHLDVDTALEIWCVTDNQTDSDSQLHRNALDLMKNRFHDYILFQDKSTAFLSDIHIKTIVKSDVMKHCSPKQKLSFLLKWLICHGPEGSASFLDCLPLLKLPSLPDSSVSLACIAQELNSAGFEKQVVMYVVKGIDKFITLRAFLNGNQRKASVVSTLELPTFWEPVDDWSLDVLSHHLPNLPVCGTNEDALIVLSPCSKVRSRSLEDEDQVPEDLPSGYPALKVCAYLMKSRLWLDLGNVDIPNDDNEFPVLVSKFSVIVCGDFLYLYNNSHNMYRLSLTSKQWEIVNPPYRDERKVLGIFALEVGETLFFVVIRDVEKSERYLDARGDNRFKWEIQTIVSLWKVDSEDDTFCEVLECPEDLIPNNGATFGPCFTQDGFIFIRLKTDAMSIEQHGCIKFDPTQESATFETFSTENDRCQSGAWGFMKNHRPPKMDASLTVSKSDWVYMFSKEKNISQRIKQEENVWHKEKENITFSEQFYRKETHAYNFILHQSLPVYVDVSVGSSLFRFINSDQGNSKGKLLEVNIGNPQVIIEHTPPSCDSIIGASLAAFPVKNGNQLKLAKFQKPDKDLQKPPEPDGQSLYAKSQAELPR